MSNKKLSPFFGRVGSKRTLKDKIYKLMPETYDLYVEPFVGGGAVFLALSRDVPIIINDKDTQLMSAYKLLKRGVKGNKKFYDTNDLAQLQHWKDADPKTNIGKLVKYMITSSNTFANKGFGKVYKRTNPYTKLKKSDDYTEKLKRCKITSGDYKKIMKKSDTATTFFYLDPPYEGTKSLYKHEKFNFDDLRDFLKTIKGKFLLSLNGSATNKKRFDCFTITSGGQAGGTGNLNNQPIQTGVSTQKRDEIFIRNY